MSKLLNGSICLSDLIKKAKQKHSSFSKSEKNGKIYCNINIWLNDETDIFGNTVSIQLNSKKELREKEGKIYIGNAKPSNTGGQSRPTEQDEFDLGGF